MFYAMANLNRLKVVLAEQQWLSLERLDRFEYD